MEKINLLVNLCGINIEVTAKYIGVAKNTTWDDNDRPKYRMAVKNTDNGKKFTTTFWGSVNDFHLNLIDVTEDLLYNMLLCIITDSQAADMPFDDFCGEFGYDPYDKKVKRIYNACVKIKEKFENIFDKSIDFYVMLDEFNEKYNE